MSDINLEEEIISKGLTASRITLEDIESSISTEYYFSAADGVDGADLMTLRKRNPSKIYTMAPYEGDAPQLETLRQITICVIILKNTMKVVGVNEGPVSESNFDSEIGKKIARQKAIDQIWPMLGYELRTKLHNK